MRPWQTCRVHGYMLAYCIHVKTARDIDHTSFENLYKTNTILFFTESLIPTVFFPRLLVFRYAVNNSTNIPSPPPLPKDKTSPAPHPRCSSC